MALFAINFFFCCQQLRPMHPHHMLLDAVFRKANPTTTFKSTVRHRKFQARLHCSEACAGGLIVGLRRHEWVPTHLRSQ